MQEIKLTDEQYNKIMFMQYQYQGLLELKHLKFSKKLLFKANAIKKMQTNYIYNIVQKNIFSWELTNEKTLLINIRE